MSTWGRRMPADQATSLRRNGEVAVGLSLLLLSLAVYVVAPFLPCGTSAHRVVAEADRLRAALRAVVVQAKRADCSPPMLLTYCRMEAERGLRGQKPVLKEDVCG